MRKIFRGWVVIAFLPFVFSCASKKANETAEAPAWTRSATRTVDNGYIVYIGVGDDLKLERAAFKAEGMALSDLANECSVAPKGARIEDRYTTQIDNAVWAYAKVAVTFEECEEGKKALQPDDVRRAANVALTEEIKRYQDLYYTSDEEDETEAKPENTATGGNSPHAAPVYLVRNDAEWFVVRQEVFYYKQNVILAPTTAYAPGAAQTIQYVNLVQPAQQQLRVYEVGNPGLRTSPTTWTHLQMTSPHLVGAHLMPNAYPPNLRTQTYHANGYRPVNRPSPMRRQRAGYNPSRRRGNAPIRKRSSQKGH